MMKTPSIILEENTIKDLEKQKYQKNQSYNLRWEAHNQNQELSLPQHLKHNQIGITTEFQPRITWIGENLQKASD